MQTKHNHIIPLSHEGGTLIQTCFGAFTCGVFIVTWLLSILSPIVLYMSISTKSHVSTGIILTLVALAYLPIWDRKGKVPTAIRSFWRTYNPMYYKKCKVLFEDTLPASVGDNKPTFYAVHPHGAVSLGWSVLYLSKCMDNVRFCFSPVLYYSPFFKLFSMITGNPGKADKKSMISYLKKGENLALPPGGFEEATITSPNQDRVYIKKRTGFVKLCLQHGYSIVPVYCFGEKETFHNVQGFWSLRFKMNSFGLPAIAIWGASWFPVLPKRGKNGFFIVAGKRIRVPKIDNPSKEEVKVWHDKYMAALTQIFEEHKVEAYGDDAKSMKLELW